MKPTAALRSFLCIASSALLTISYAQAINITWDPTGGGTSDGAGAWLTAGDWWNGTSNVNWTTGDDAIFGNGGAGGAVTLASPTIVNSLTFNSFTGTYTLGTAGQTITLNNGITMNSGAGAATIISPITLGAAQSWTNNDDSLLTIGTGAVTNAGFLLTVGGTGNTTISSVIGGSGGLTKTGAGILTLSGANTFTGQLTVANGTLSIASINNVNANGTLGNSNASLPVILGSSGGNTGTLRYTAASGSSDKSFMLATGGTGAFDVTTALTLSGLINGSGGLSKTGAGTLTLSNNPNQFTGNTVISNGKVALGGQFAMWQSAYDTTGSTGAIGLNVTGQATPWLGGLAGSVNLATAITGYGSVTALTLNPQSGSSVSYGGVIANGSGAMTLSKTGHGTQTLTGANSYSGATTVWAGTLSLAGASGTALNSAFTVRGGTLELDNSTNLVASRLTDGTALSLGSMTLKGFNTGGVQGEAVGATTFAVGGKVTVINGTAVGDRTTLALGAVTRSAGAAIDFVGTNGTLGGAGDTPNVTTTGTFPGGSNGILPWATVNGTTWAGTATTNSIVAYAGGFVDPTSAASNAANNAQLTGTGIIASAKSFNSLNVISSGAGQSLNLSANTGNLTLTSGAILKSGTDAYTISSSGSPLGNITAGTELIAHVNGGALTISAPLNTAIDGIAKGGTGDLILSGTRDATFGSAISIAGGQLEFRGNSTNLSGVITGAGGLTVNLNAGQTLTVGNNANSYAGPTIVKGGYLTQTTYNSIGLPGGLGKTPPRDNTSLIGTNLILDGGIFYSQYTFDKDLGAGPNQVQVLAGTSGFVNTANSGGAASFVLDGSREIVWGSTYFNPTVFVHSLNNGANLTLNLANGFDLAGSTRTILVGDSTYNGSATGISQLGGVIRTSSGTAGLIKTGIGELLLTGASTYNGAITVSAGTLSFQGNANVASANPLGQSSAAAANLLLANGTTLKYSGAAASIDRGFTINGTADGHSASLNASGSAAINFTNTASPAYGTTDQTRTLTLTGTNTNNNILAANLADNGTGAVSVTKTGTGLWVLSGTSSYTGPTTLNAGTLSASAVANLGAASSNLVFNEGTFQPTGGTFLNFSSIGHTVVFNSGQTVGLDIPSGTFTVDQVLNQGTGGLTKLGAGTLVIDSAHTYTGITTISAGTLRLDDGGVIPNSMVNNGVLLVNKTGAVNIGTDFPAMIGGSGSIAFGASSTLTITTPTQFESSALNTTGGGSVTLSGVTTPVFGGLVGTTGNLSSAFSSGYSGVTNLTLNTPSGTTFTYAGVINDGATGMSVTKIGAGTQILTGNNTYTGTTFLNGGTLQLGTLSPITIGKLSGTTGLTFNGGTLQFNRSTNANIDAINDAAPITVNISSTFGVTSADAGGASANETVGAVTLNAGQMNFNWTNGGSSGTIMTLTSLSRSGTASANFNSGFASNNSRWKVTGAGTTAGGQIVGPWLTTGGNNAGFASTDYAVYASDFVAQANIAANNTETSWASAANIHVSATATTLTATRTLNTLRYSAAAGSIALGANNLETYGLLNGGSGLLTVSGTGALTTPTGGGNLYVTSGSNSITVSAPINNNGGNVTLVKNGGNTLTLTNNSNNYSGGTVLNAGTLVITNDGQLGVGGGITVNGTVTINGGDQYNLPRTLTLNEGATLTSNNGFGVTGVFSGNGALSVTSADDHNFTNAANTFTGAITSATSLNIGYGLKFNSIGDTAGAGLITLVGGSGTFHWMSASGSTTTLANRQFAISGAGAGIISARGTTAASNLVINQDLLITGAAGARTLRLIGANLGNNTFAGKITDGPGSGSVVSLTKEEAGLWIVSGTNTYTGTTTVSAGTLALTNANAIQNSALTISGGILSLLHNTNNTTFNNAGTTTISASATLNVNNNGSGTGNTLNLGGAVNVTAATTATLTVTNANSYVLGLGAVTQSPATATTLTIANAAPLTMASFTTNSTATPRLAFTGLGTATITGNITQSGSGALALERSTAAGTLILQGTSNMTGAVTISNGAIQTAVATNAFGSTTGIGIGASGILALRGDSSAAFSNGTTNYPVTLSASGATINVDQASSATLGTTLTLGTVSMPGAYTLNTTGANGVSLALGAVSASTANNKVINNTIATPGGLTIASYAEGNASAQSITIQGTGNTTVTGAITQNGANALALTKSGNGILTLSGTSSYTGITTITSGVVEAATLDNGGNDSSIGKSSNAAASLVFGAPASTLRYTGGSSVTIDRGFTPSSGVGGGATIESSGAGTLSFNNTVALAYGTNTGGAGTQTRTLTLGGTNIGANTFGKVIANNTGTSNLTSIVKSGGGTWVLNQNNTYSGSTSVNAGTLAVSAGNINSTSGITVAAGATFAYNSSTALTVGPTLNGTGTLPADRAVLSGTGPINIGVTLDNVGDVLSPGNSPGIQNYDVAQTWNSFSYDWEVNNFTGTTPGTHFDQLTLDSTLNLSGGSGSYILNVLGLTAGDIAGLVPNFSETIQSWTILTSTGITNFDDANWTINTAGFTNNTPSTGTWSLAQSGNDLVLTYAPIPEPRVALLGALSLLTLLRRRR